MPRRYNLEDITAAQVLREDADRALAAALDAGAVPGDGSPADQAAADAQTRWQQAVITANRNADENKMWDEAPIC